ncbi:unnamed protein product [Brassica oleracea]
MPSWDDGRQNYQRYILQSFFFFSLLFGFGLQQKQSDAEFCSPEKKGNQSIVNKQVIEFRNRIE